jgi:uncharacterized LabA/DUF88 family protein
MASSPDITSMALFCDFENVALGVRETHHEKFDIKLVLERLLLKGSIVVKKAYCDWERYKGFKSSMHEASFELIEIPHVRQSGKNSADIRLVVDALDLCYTKSHVNTFVIISGDSDFSPLVSKLRENNKQVIGVGVKQSTSDLLVSNCDEFIFYDDLVRESGRQSIRREQRPAQEKSRRPAPASGNSEDDRRRDEAENRKTKAVELALETFDALYSERGDGGKIWASVLKEAIKRRKPDFSESYYGFRSFGGLLEEMQARGFLEMGRDEKSNAYVFRSNGAAPAATPAPAAEAPAAPEVLPVTYRAGEPETRERGRRGARGGRRKGPDRHEFEPAVAVDAVAQADADDEDDDAAERFADAARQTQAARSVLPPAEPAPDADTYLSEDGAAQEAGVEAGERAAGGRRSNRGGRGRGNAARKTAGAEATPVGEAVPVPAPVAPPAPEHAPAPAPAPRPARARKTAAKAAEPVAEAPAVPAAKKAPARKRAPRKTSAAE